MWLYGSSHEILVFIAYAQMSLINAIAGVSSEANIGLNFGLRLGNGARRVQCCIKIHSRRSHNVVSLSFRHFIRCVVLFQHRKTGPDLSEKWLFVT